MSKKDQAPHGDLVVVGSSAGGVEALSTLVSTLPLNFPAPIVLAQHLDPNHPSALDVILQRRTNLPIEVVNSNCALQAGTIYVVPANRHVSVHDGHVIVQESRLKRPRPSVDTLLSTAADAYGEHLIAVILTGTGSDGAVGAVDVKNAGGTVIAQNPQTARYPSMPLAIPPTVVDFEADIEKIGPLLYDLLTGVNIPQKEERTEDVLREILDMVSRQASIDFRSYKTSTILRRIGRRMTITHHSSMRDYAAFLKTYPQEVGELVKAILINVTQFFRDPEAFDYLKKEILPKLIAHARSRQLILRIWTAGCATGEESYSLAMLLSDLLGNELPRWSVKIFATDLDEAAISFARRGLYSENLLKGVPLEYRERFFERIDHGYRISKTLRQMVIFGQQDLSRSAPFPHIDLVLCRNVLIYFTPELQDYVLNQFAFSLSPDGYLFLGKAETVRPAQLFYELINKHWKVYSCIGNALPTARRQSLPIADMHNTEHHGVNRSHNHPASAQIGQEPTGPGLELGQIKRLNELLLRFLPNGVVVIDRTYRILSTNGTARRLLGLRDFAGDQDFLHAVRGIPYQETRSAIDTVFRERTPITLTEVELATNMGGSGRFIGLTIAPMPLEMSTSDLAIMTITDVTEQVQIRRQLESIQAEQARLMQELNTSNKRLSDMNKELLDANEELQVANEELVLTHEELQASIEEFETTNEELQATNEELETNNEELQATNEELETTNDELRARTGELQELTSTLENERVRLTEIMEIAPFSILVLRSPRLIVEAYTPHHARHLAGQPIQGRPLDEVFDLFWRAEEGVAIVQLAREVYRLDSTRTSPRIRTSIPTPSNGQNDPTESYVTFTLVPSHDAQNHVNGVIMYAVDETMQRAREIAKEREQLQLIFENATVALALYDAQTAELIIGSPRYLESVASVHGITPAEVDGRLWHEIAFTPSQEEATQLWKTVIESTTTGRLSEVHIQLDQHSAATTWNCSLIPIMDTRQQSVRFLLITAVEITEQVQARQEVEELDRLKDNFLSLATHELRTPLTSILANAQLLQRNLHRHTTADQNEHSLQRAQQEHRFEQEHALVERITRQVNRMNKLIEEVLEVTRIRIEGFELRNRQHTNIVALVRHVVEEQPAPDRELITYLSDEDLFVMCDEDRIEQVLNNLLSNAIKYSPARTPIVITLERSHEHPEEVVITVKDQGSGIKTEEQVHIFERFYRVRTEDRRNVAGLGLGLYIAHEIVAQHSGSMWLESTYGLGSTFYFSLPLASA
ncbi:MAG TPA: CheR family methyltransferase [Ktedonosporobacter sp.]|nr:CheR family methyltransferase [Ktedonosporobacter sp.]